MTILNKDTNERLKLREKFETYYYKNLCQDYKELENIRQSCIKRVKKWSIIFSISTTFLLYLHINNTINLKLIWLIDGLDRLYLTLCGIYFYIFIFLIALPFKNYKEKTQKNNMQKIINFFNNDFRYDVGTITTTELKKSQLFDSYDHIEVINKFSGIYSDHKISINETQLNKRVQAKRCYNLPIFRGIIIKVNTNNKYQNQIIVKHDKGIFKYFSFPNMKFIIFQYLSIFPIILYLYLYLQLELRTFILITISIPLLIYRLMRSKNIIKKQIPLEDITFEKEWDVFSQNPIEARYILTPALMERMVKIKKIFHGKNIEFSFFNNKIIIAIPTKENVFETSSLLSSATEFKLQFKVICQIYQILKLIDTLKLKNNKISEF